MQCLETLSYTAIRCDTLLYVATRCYRLLYAAICCYSLLYGAIRCYTLLYTTDKVKLKLDRRLVGGEMFSDEKRAGLPFENIEKYCSGVSRHIGSHANTAHSHVKVRANTHQESLDLLETMQIPVSYTHLRAHET